MLKPAPIASDTAATVMPQLTDTFQPVNKQLNALYSMPNLQAGTDD